MGEAPVDDRRPVLAVEHLSVAFRAPARERGQWRRPLRTVVDDVSFTVDDGQSVALIGASGSGKTTISLAVAGVGTITSGSIRVLDETLDADRPRLRRRRADVQMVLQDPFSSLDPRQSIRSGLRELAKLHPERTGWTDHHGLLSLVRLDPSALDRYPHELSGGQLQRVSIARAVYLRPKVLIADEPTSALDVATQTQILDLLLTLRQEIGIALLFVTHDLAVVDQVADQVLVLNSGRIVERGTRDEILRSPHDDYTRRLLDALPGRRMAAILQST
jgi:ABC-type glutathione transport system ATPase component